MKKIFASLMVLATLATVFSSCSKEADVQKSDKVFGKMKTITVKTDIETRTTLDTDHTNLIWSSGDKISIFNDQDNTNLEEVYEAGADLIVSVPAATKEIYAHYPYYVGNEKGPKEASVYITNTQKQTNPGELNGYYYPMVAKGTVTDDNKALISLYPVASALALNLYHSGLSGEENVLSVKVTPSSSNTGFTGSQTTDLTTDNVKYTQGASSNPITVTLTNPLSLGNAAPADKQKFPGQIYVCLAKQSYANVKFEIETDKGKYTITSSSTPFDCVNNDFVPVNINLNKASFEENETAVDPTTFSWTLVEDALAVDDLVVIAAAESDVAMSVTQNTNNRGQIAITKSGISLTANANVQVFKVVTGSKNGTFALKCMNGDELGNYIAAASSSSNYMHSNGDIDDNASWSISIDDDGIAAVVAQGTYTRNTIRYNSNNSVFSCYGSGMADIVFYRPGLPSADLSFPQDSYSATLGESFTAPELSNPYGVSVTYSSSNSSVASVNASTGAVTIGAVGSVTITASFAGNDTYSASEASYEIIVVDPDAEQWVKTAIGSITAGDVFVIVGDDGYALPHNNGSSSAPGLVAVTISNSMITSTVSDDIKWNVSGNAADGYVFYPNGNNSTWLYCTNTNNGVRVGDNNNKLFTIDNNGYLVNIATSRYLSVYGTQDWRCYNNTNNNPQVIEFYVKQGGSTPTKTLSSITVTPPTKTTYTVGDAFDATGMVVTATYSDATTADVTNSATTDFATQVASAGNKTVTVSYTEGAATKTDTFNITVNPASGSSTVTFTPGTDTDATTVTKDGITVTMTTMDNSDYYQVYANQSMTVSSETHTITGISFTCTASGTAKYGPGNARADVGNYSYSGSTGTWTGSASSVSISSTAQIRMTSLTITYE